MKKQKVDKKFVSEIDKRLKEFRRTHSKSASQLAEIKKYQRIYEMRDNRIITSKKTEGLWD